MAMKAELEQDVELHGNYREDEKYKITIRPTLFGGKMIRIVPFHQ